MALLPFRKARRAAPARRPRARLRLECLEDRLTPSGWAFRVGGRADSVVFDPAGNMYVNGTFQGTADFDPAPDRVTNLSTASPDRHDIFLVKYSPALEVLWARRIGGPDWYDETGTIEVDAAGNVYLAARTQSAYLTVTGTNGYVGPTLAPVGTPDALGIYWNGLVAKFAPDGEVAWARRYGGTGQVKGTMSGHRMAVGPDGAVTVTGSVYKGSVDFDPQAASAGDTLTSAGDHDVYVVRYNTDGAFRWVRRAGGAGTDIGQGVAVDAAGNAYVGGRFAGTVAFGPDQRTALGGDDAFLTKLDAAGTFLWTRQLGGATAAGGGDAGVAVRVYQAVAGAEAVYVGGQFTTDAATGPAAFGDPTRPLDAVTTLTSSGTDSFVARLTPDGDFVWARHFAGGGDGVVTNLAVDAAGAVYSTGFFFGATDFDPADAGTALLTPISGAGSDAFVAMLDAAGAYAWAGRMGAQNASTDWGLGLTVDATGGVYMTGYGGGDPFAADTGLGSSVTLPGNGTLQGFVVKADLAGITGRVVADLDNDGTADIGETFLAGWTAFLDANQNGALDTGERTSVTD
jgi:hypothetical protein